jgi:ArsR family transcriptional regulator
MFNALADETRLRILNVFLSRGEMCVSGLQHVLGLSQPKISRHVAILKHSGFLASKRKGKLLMYKVKEQEFLLPNEILRSLKKCSLDIDVFRNDLRKASQVLAGSCGCVLKSTSGDSKKCA